ANTLIANILGSCENSSTVNFTVLKNVFEGDDVSDIDSCSYIIECANVSKLDWVTKLKKRHCVLWSSDVLDGSMFLNLDQLGKQLDKEEFQEIGSFDAFRVLMTQFQTFINFLYYFDNDEGLMIRKESILERAKHKREKDRRVNDRMMQSKERKDNSSKALDPMAEVHMSAEHNILANEQQHSEQSASVYDTYLLEKEKVFANAALKNELRKSKGNNMDIKFAKPSILGKPVLQPPRNQSVVRQPNAFKSERPNFSKPRFASQVDVNNVLSKPVTPHYLSKVRESAPAKPHHVNAPSSSRNNKKESYGYNDMARNYYLEEAKKKTHDKNRNLKPREMPFAKTYHTPNACIPKPRSNNQISRNWPISKSCEETLKARQKIDHSRNPSLFSDFKHFVCSTCQKCVFNANHDVCITNS
nr:actin-binding, cofilin/tropomyosin type [Tanacetum cinerariifolium]